MEKQFHVLGRSVERLDVRDKVTGTVQYTSDMVFPNMLIAKLVGSPYAHARIKSIDKSAAEAVPGVKTILTWKDVPRVPYSTREREQPEGELRGACYSTAGYPKETIPGVVPVPMEYLEDKYLLDYMVNYPGEAVAVVVAIDEDAAAKAVKLLKVDYEVLPHAITIEEALAEDAPLVHMGTRKNVIDTQICKGNVEEAFAQAAYIFEDEYEAQPQQHVCLETSCSVAKVDPSGRVTLWSTTQVPFHIRRGISEVLGLPMHKIRVIKPALGGGFGERQMVQNEFLCVFAAMKTGQPVKLETTREENTATMARRHQAKFHLKSGLSKEGEIIAFQVDVHTNAGAYTGHSPYVTKAMCTKNPYRMANLQFNASIVFTNQAESGAYRGYGNPQISFAREMHFDRVARELGMDPVEFRRKNLIRVGEQNPVSLKADWILESCELDQCLVQGAEAIQWYAPKKPDQGGKKYGKGVCAAIHVTGTSASPDFSSAYIKVNEDGTVMLLIGSPDLGQGSDTCHAQIAAEALGVRIEDVSVLSADTDVTSFDMGSYASRQTYVGGNAVKKAALQAKEHIIRFASEMTGQVAGNLETADGWVIRRENGRKIATFADVAHYAVYQSKNPMFISESASYSSLNCPPSMAAHFAEVEVDTETGEIKVLNFVAAHDAGTAVNPAMIEGQIEGSVAQGLGYTLTEDMIYNEQGILMNGNFTEYKVPRTLDMPNIKSIIVASHDPSGPFGAKGVGEMAIAPVPGAIANAVYDAIGIRFTTLPITKEKVLHALKNR